MWYRRTFMVQEIRWFCRLSTQLQQRKAFNRLHLFPVNDTNAIGPLDDDEEGRGSSGVIAMTLWLTPSSIHIHASEPLTVVWSQFEERFGQFLWTPYRPLPNRLPSDPSWFYLLYYSCEKYDTYKEMNTVLYELPSQPRYYKGTSFGVFSVRPCVCYVPCTHTHTSEEVNHKSI